MKAKYNYILFLLFLGLTSCNKQEIALTGMGFFSLDELALSCDGEIIPLTRAVDAELCIQLWQNDALLYEYPPGSDFTTRILLPAGAYTLKAFTLNEEEVPNEERGNPAYRLERNFSIVEQDITTLSLVVPQSNVGVFVHYNQWQSDVFKEIKIEITSVSGRTVTIKGTTDEELRYFNLPADGKLSYTLSARNADDEVFHLTQQLVAASAKNYKLVIDMN